MLEWRHFVAPTSTVRTAALARARGEIRRPPGGQSKGEHGGFSSVRVCFLPSVCPILSFARLVSSLLENRSAANTVETSSTTGEPRHVAHSWLFPAGGHEVPSIAEAYEDKAHDAYCRWGALGKARHLARHSRPDAQPSAEESVSDTTSVRIDVLTLVKAQQAISREIVLDQLASTLLHVAIENA